MGPLRLTGGFFLTETDKERPVSPMVSDSRLASLQVSCPGLASACGRNISRGLGSVSFH